jgi:hypothetical protein
MMTRRLFNLIALFLLATFSLISAAEPQENDQSLPDKKFRLGSELYYMTQYSSSARLDYPIIPNKIQSVSEAPHDSFLYRLLQNLGDSSYSAYVRILGPVASADPSIDWERLEKLYIWLHTDLDPKAIAGKLSRSRRKYPQLFELLIDRLLTWESITMHPRLPGIFREAIMLDWKVVQSLMRHNYFLRWSKTDSGAISLADFANSILAVKAADRFVEFFSSSQSRIILVSLYTQGYYSRANALFSDRGSSRVGFSLMNILTRQDFDHALTDIMSMHYPQIALHLSQEPFLSKLDPFQAKEIILKLMQHGEDVAEKAFENGDRFYELLMKLTRSGRMETLNKWFQRAINGEDLYAILSLPKIKKFVMPEFKNMLYFLIDKNTEETNRMAIGFLQDTEILDSIPQKQLNALVELIGEVPGKSSRVVLPFFSRQIIDRASTEALETCFLNMFLRSDDSFSMLLRNEYFMRRIGFAKKLRITKFFIESPYKFRNLWKSLSEHGFIPGDVWLFLFYRDLRANMHSSHKRETLGQFILNDDWAKDEIRKNIPELEQEMGHFFDKYSLSRFNEKSIESMKRLLDTRLDLVRTRLVEGGVLRPQTMGRSQLRTDARFASNYQKLQHQSGLQMRSTAGRHVSLPRKIHRGASFRNNPNSRPLHQFARF